MRTMRILPTFTAASARSWSRSMLLSIACALILAGCNTIPTTPTHGLPTDQEVRDPLNPFCLKDKVIPYSARLDRPALVAMVREHNAVWRTLCPSAEGQK